MANEVKILAACGNDCAACPRYVAPPHEKTREQLERTAGLWMKTGYRDRVVSPEEIACEGCRPENWCRYGVVSCAAEKGVRHCGECPVGDCERLRACFEVTRSFEPACRRACNGEEYEALRRAFFEKEKNLGRE